MKNFQALCACVSAFGLASIVHAQITLAPGLDAWQSVNPTQVTFGGEFPPIPPSFFAPGSDPFIGTIQFNGAPIDPAVSPADTIVQRLAPANVSPSMPATIPIEIVELRLQSVAPITVNTPGGPTQWDVRVDLSPAPASTGSAMIFVNPTLTGGQFFYQSSLNLRLTFTSVLDSTSVVLDLGTGASSLQTSWSTTQPGLHYPGSGPNFFPSNPQGWQSPGSGFMQQRIPALGADCNGNGVIDSQDLDNSTSVDGNMNRIPDECEAQVHLEQISWLNAAGGFAQRYSAFGRLVADIIEPPDGSIVWLNAVVSGNWVIQNCPIHNLQSAGDPGQRLVEFDLRNVPGTQVPSAGLVSKFTTQPLNAPPAGTPAGVLVLERPASRGMEFDSLADLPLPFDTWFPTIPQDFINPAIPVVWETVARRNVMGVEEMVNGCAPGAGARSLDWMNHLYCLGFPAGLDTAQELYDKLRNAMHMMTTADGTATPKIKSGIEKCIMDMMLQNVLEVKEVNNPTGDDIFNALKGGNDVMCKGCLTDGVKTWYHRFAVVGGTKCGNSITIEIRDDDQQSAGADTGSHTGTVTTGPGGTTTSGFGATCKIVSMLVICPKRAKMLDAINKYINGDGPTGMTEGIKSLLERIIGGYMPTAAEKKALKNWACNVLDIICYLREQLNKVGTPAARAAADRLKTRYTLLKADVTLYVITMDPAWAGLALADINHPDHAADQLIVKRAVDCNMNGVDDTVDIANSTSPDANGDMIDDNCQCLADWNNSGSVTVQDLFDFLADWFAHSADYNHSGATTVQDLFDFLAAWFARCP